MIFVFGSNLDGRHGAGSARYAYLHKGAELGVGEGMTGGAYALPTVGHNLERMSFERLVEAVGTFVNHALANPIQEFQVTRVGCGLAGFTDQQVASLFVGAPSNCLFDEAWKEFLPSARFWGVF